MHWFWRAAIAVAVAGCWPIVWTLLEVWFLKGSTSHFADIVGAELYRVSFTASSAIIALGVFAILTRIFGADPADRELHCRRCGYILHGLSEPRCPECGEAI